MRQFSFPSWRFRLGLLVVLTAMGVVGMWRNSHELVVVSVTTLAAGWAGMDFLLMRRLKALVSATKRVATGEPEARTGLADEPEELGQLARAVDQIAEAKQTQQLEAERAKLDIQESEERFHLLVQGVKDFAIFMLDARGRVVSWNAGAERIMGHRADEIVGEHISLIFTDEDLQRGKPEYELKMAEAVGRFEDNGWRMRNDGSRFWANVILTALRDQAGNLRGFAKVIRDITGSKRAEEALRDSEERARLISGLTSDYTYAFRIMPNGRIVREWVTDAFTRITGFTPEEFDAQGWENLPHTDDRHFLAERVDAMLAGRADVREFRVITKGGETRWLRDYARPVVDQGWSGVVRVVGAAQDITEHKRAEEELEQSRQRLRNLAARLQSTLEEERTHVARELHDELSPALTNLKIDLSWLDKNVSEAGRAVSLPPLLEKINAMANQVDATINSMRKISSRLRPGVLDNFGLTAAIEWQTQEFQARTGIRCELALPSEAILLDEVRTTAIFRIFQEALTNVVRHSTASRVNVGVKLDRGDLVLEVQDNGKGITAAEIVASDSLGLVGMRERALALEGNVNISGIPGRGTTVRARIPLRQGDGATAISQRSESSAVGGESANRDAELAEGGLA